MLDNGKIRVARNKHADSEVWASRDDRAVHIDMDPNNYSAPGIANKTFSLDEAIEIRDALTLVIENIQSFKPKEPTYHDTLRAAPVGAYLALDTVSKSPYYFKVEADAWQSLMSGTRYPSSEFFKNTHVLVVVE